MEKSWLPDVERGMLIDLGGGEIEMGYGLGLMKARPYAFDYHPLEDHTVFEQSFGFGAVGLAAVFVRVGSPVDLAAELLGSRQDPPSTVDCVSLLVAEGDDIYAVLEHWDPPHSTKGDDSRLVDSGMAVVHNGYAVLVPCARASGEVKTLAAASVVEVSHCRFQ